MLKFYCAIALNIYIVLKYVEKKYLYICGKHLVHASQSQLPFEICAKMKWMRTAPRPVGLRRSWPRLKIARLALDSPFSLFACVGALRESIPRREDRPDLLPLYCAGCQKTPKPLATPETAVRAQPPSLTGCSRICNPEKEIEFARRRESHLAPRCATIEKSWPT